MGKGKPQGPRDVMRDLGLSSPSVAYRHLQKLENLGFIQKDSYGQYAVKEKVSIKGHLWVGRNLVPRLIFYSFFFLGILTAEIIIIAVRLSAAETPRFDFVFLTVTTAVTMLIFLLEGMKLLLKVKKE
ncbi:MAG: hypothetical protein ABSB28_09310 [Candidatus Bathyarchaeia archaeon]